MKPADLELFLEEPSAEAALRELVPRIVGRPIGCRYHPFQGKPELLKSLPNRLAALAGARVLVLHDTDGDDCQVAKRRLEELAARAGFTTPSAAPAAPTMFCRLAVPELEAWFLGDPAALRAAYPRLPARLAERPCCRQPDRVRQPKEVLDRLLRAAGYRDVGRIELARRVARRMTPDDNRSHSFGVFRDAVRRLAP